ncbi:ExeM/NucH family extracellular endonuclease [Xylophilus sp. GW821-FHT01B05]
MSSNVFRLPPLALAALLATSGAWAQVSFTGNPYTQNFDTLAASGTNIAWANDSTLPGWFLFNKDMAAITTYVASTGSSSTGSFHSMGTSGSTDRALGSVTSGGAYFGSPASGELAGWIALAARNDTAAAIDGVTLTFNGEQWRNGGNTSAQKMRLEYGLGDTFDTVTTWAAAGDRLDWTSPITGATAAAVDGNAAGRVNNVGGDLRGLDWAPGATLWLRWVANNNPGNDHGLAIDDVSLSIAGPDTTPPELQSSTPADAATGVSLSTDITLRFDEAVRAGSGSFELRQGTDVVATLPVTDNARVVFSSSSITIKPGVSLNPNTAYSLVPMGTPVTDTSGNAWAGAALAFTTGERPIPTLISAIQGSGDQSPMLGQSRTVSAVMTAYMPGLSGFFLQEEAADSDGDDTTSEGIFVYYGTTNPGVDDSTVGQLVQLTANVSEFYSQTQLSGNITNFQIMGPAAVPAPVRITLPISSMAQWERYEGMRVEVASATAGGQLVVSDNYTLGRYGDVTLAADRLLPQFSELNAPSTAGYSAYVQATQRSQVILDDGSSTSNPDPVRGRNGQPLSATNTLRAGDSVGSIVGVLDQYYNAATAAAYQTSYRVQPTQAPNFTGPARPTSADLQQAVGAATVKIASANVLNFFSVTGATSVTFTTPLGNSIAIRGANNATELERQRAKVVANLIGLGADVYGLMEVQNNGYGDNSAIKMLVDTMNVSADRPTGAVYDYVKAPLREAAGTVAGAGTDAITVAIIYRSDRVTPVGAAAVPNVGTYDAFTPNVGGARVPIAQTFSVMAASGAEQFTLVVNHFKSKGSVLSGAANADLLDGQGANNAARVRTAEQLKTWLATDPTGAGTSNVVLVGDFNAYAKEDPITYLETNGFTKVTQGYSYSFDGLWGSLDHILVSQSLAAKVGRAVKWAINAEEPVVLDYNTEFKTAAQVSGYYAPTAYRSSDHNPILMGLTFGNQAPTISGVPTSTQTVTVGQAADLADVTVAGGSSDSLTLTVTSTNGQVLGLVDANTSLPGIQLVGTPAQINSQFSTAVFIATAPGSASVNLSVSDGVNPSVTASYALNAVAAAAADPAKQFSVAPTAQIAVAGEVTGGGATCRLTAAPQLLSMAAVGASGLPRPNVSLPHGLLNLNTDGCDTGAVVTVKLTYPSPLPAGAEYWKWGPTTDNVAPHWYRIPATLDGNVITFVLRDGGLGDDDMSANGRIVDPSALVVPAAAAVGGGTATAVPTLSEWGLILLSLSVGLLAYRRQGGWRRRA